jgi:hypothetical protein
MGNGRRRRTQWWPATGGGGDAVAALGSGLAPMVAAALHDRVRIGGGRISTDGYIGGQGWRETDDGW